MFRFFLRLDASVIKACECLPVVVADVVSSFVLCRRDLGRDLAFFCVFELGNSWWDAVSSIRSQASDDGTKTGASALNMDKRGYNTKLMTRRKEQEVAVAIARSCTLIFCKSTFSLSIASYTLSLWPQHSQLREKYIQYVKCQRDKEAPCDAFLAGLER